MQIHTIEKSSNMSELERIIAKYPDKDWDWGFNGLSGNDFNFSMSPLTYYKQRKIETLRQTAKIKEELIATTWHPDRVMDWCFDDEEKKEISESFM